jgi:hypothetical protein
MSQFDIASDFNILGGLPRGAARQALDASIADEGGKVLDRDKVLLSNGDQVAWTPLPEKLVIQDLSLIKSIRHYFGQHGYQVYPAWLYHPTKEPILVKNHREAAEHGVVYRETTRDERNRFGVQHMWDWEEGVEWRPTPWQEPKFDPKNPGSGKTVIWQAPDPANEQHKLVAALIPAVAAAVAQSLKASGPAAPSSVDPGQWAAFLEFQAWQKTKEVVETAASGASNMEGPEGEQNALFGANALTPEQDRLLWEEEATKRGVKVDRRWSLERLRAEVEKAGG